MCVAQGTTLATSTSGKQQAGAGAKIAWGLGNLTGAGGEGQWPGAGGQGGVANSIPMQASVRVHSIEPKGGEGQSIMIPGWPCSQSGRKNKMKKESRKLSPALRNGSATGTRQAQDLVPVCVRKRKGNGAPGTQQG